MSKEWESSIDGDIPLDTMMYSYDFGIFSWGDLQSALLKYRRQHNIYEVGDKVVFRKCSGIGGASDVIDLMTVKSIYAFGVRMTNSLCPWAIQIRPATDEEIKAGKRL